MTAITINETAGRQYLKMACVTAGGILGVSLLFSAGGAIVAGAMGWDVLFVGGGILAAGILGASFAVYDGLNVAGWILVNQIASKIAREAAETERIRAEAAAIQGGTAVIQNTQVNAKGRAQVAISQPIIQENTRLIPVRTPHKLIDDIPVPAIAFFVDQYDIRGWTQRAWVKQGLRVPGLDREMDYDTWRQMVTLIEKVGGCAPVNQGSKVKAILPLDVIRQKLLSDGTDSTDVIDATGDYQS